MDDTLGIGGSAGDGSLGGSGAGMGGHDVFLSPPSSSVLAERYFVDAMRGMGGSMGGVGDIGLVMTGL